MKVKKYNKFYFVFTDDPAYPFKNSYMIVEGFDGSDAAKKVVDKFGKTSDEHLPYACCFYIEEWTQMPELRECYKYVGTLRPNGIFEEAE